MKKKKNVLLSLNKKRVSELNKSLQQEIVGGTGNGGQFTHYSCGNTQNGCTTGGPGGGGGGGGEWASYNGGNCATGYQCWMG